MENLEVVDLKTFVRLARKHETRYIRIRPQENKLLMKLDKTVSVLGHNKTLDLWYETNIEIETTIGSLRPPQHKKEDLETIHLHGHLDASVLLTLLRTRPEKLIVTYWPINDCELLSKKGLHNETIFIATPKKHLVRFEQAYEYNTQRRGRFKHEI